MKSKALILAAAASLAVSTAALAQVQFTITGSTAFRSIVLDRVPTVFDAGWTAVTNDATTGKITYSGTMHSKIPSLGATQVKVRLSFSGSASGMLAVKNQTQVSTAETPGVNVNVTPDLAFSDVYPSSATPPISETEVEVDQVGVVPFVFARNNALTGISNITREQAVLLMTASGDGGMPASYLGGASSSPVYLTGRDSGSGTRITVEKVIGFSGTPLLWTTNGAGVLITTNGLSSGGLVRGVVASKSQAIGYLGLGDFNVIAGSATQLTYNGVPYSSANVANGSYSLWGYQHVVNRINGLSANQGLVRNAIINAIKDPTFQGTAAVYTGAFVPISSMTVERGVDGGPITSLDF